MMGKERLIKKWDQEAQLEDWVERNRLRNPAPEEVEYTLEEAGEKLKEQFANAKQARTNWTRYYPKK